MFTPGRMGEQWSARVPEALGLVCFLFLAPFPQAGSKAQTDRQTDRLTRGGMGQILLDVSSYFWDLCFRFAFHPRSQGRSPGGKDARVCFFFFCFFCWWWWWGEMSSCVYFSTPPPGLPDCVWLRGKTTVNLAMSMSVYVDGLIVTHTYT